MRQFEVPSSSPRHDGRRLRALDVVDEYTRQCLAIRVGRRLKAADVIDVLADLFILRGVPGYIRSDNVLDREGAGRIRPCVSVASLH